MAFHQLPVFAAVVLRRGDQVLLLKRGLQASFAPEQYSVIGGAVELGETFRETVVREAWEEVGISINPENLRFIHVIQKQIDGFDLVVCFFECDNWEGEPFNKEPHKHSELVWKHRDDLPETMVHEHRSVIDLANKGLFYSEYIYSK